MNGRKPEENCIPGFACAVAAGVTPLGVYDSDVAPRNRRRPLSAQAIDMIAARFRILGEPLRIRLLQELQEGEKSVGELVTAVGSTQPNVSKHLRILQEAGLVGRRQVGNLVYCFIDDPSVFDLCNAVCETLSERLAESGRLAGELNRGIGGR